MGRKLYPIPEAVRSGPWEIADGPGSTCLDDDGLVMRAPLSSTSCGYCGHDHGRSVRAHEIGHVRWSPADWREQVAAYSVNPLTVLAVEDARLTLLRSATDNAIPGIGVCPEKLSGAIAGMVGETDVRAATVYATAGGIGAESAILDATLRRIEEADEDPRIRQTARSARELSTTAREMLGRDPFPRFVDTMRVAAWLDEQFPNAEESVERAKAPGGNETPDAEYGTGDGYGTMTVETAPLTMPADRAAWRTRQREEGTYPRRPDRLLTDGRPFGERRRQYGGALLIDASGSMEWSVDDMRALMRSCPAATVGIYSGNGEDGKLRVVARGGKRASDEYIDAPDDCRFNTVDGPALRWLADQSGPRVWYSDGAVNGAGDASSLTLSDVADDIMASAGIRRTTDPGEAARIMRGRRGLGSGASDYFAENS